MAFKDRYRVLAVNPERADIEGKPCYGRSSRRRFCGRDTSRAAGFR